MNFRTGFNRHESRLSVIVCEFIVIDILDFFARSVQEKLRYQVKQNLMKW